MRHFALVSILLLASAQLGLAVVFNVTVGGAGVLKFTPEFLDAAVGDVVRFVFQQKNHTVTQSNLANPCQPLPRGEGFDTGFVPVNASVVDNFPTAELTVRTNASIWAYCRQGNHCSSSGMVFAVNPGPNFAAFKAAATGGTPSSTRPPVVSSTSGAVPTSSGTPSSIDHKVIVGDAGLTFNPPNITANAGDTITFEFRQKNHTVTASSFEEPCNNFVSTTGQAGFDSGYKPVGAAGSFPTYTLQVNDTKPIWAFCKQGTHCKSGMVFSANANESSPKTFAAFQAAAKGSTGPSTTGPYGGPSSAAWRPVVGSSSMVVVLSLSAASLLL